MSSIHNNYKNRQVGSKYTTDYRLYIENENGKVISPFHDIPLYNTKDGRGRIVNMICEIPRYQNAKLEISKEEKWNPIKQDVKKGNLRFVKNCFPYMGYIWNYGALPQTWESPKENDKLTGLPGDNDPIDVLEIGSTTLGTGQVAQVKVLGALAMIDEGETDWKILVIKTDDPLANKLENIGNIEEHLPGLLDATRDWFRIYKIPDGKPPNNFAFEGKILEAQDALKIIDIGHSEWKNLIKVNPFDKIDTTNREIADTPGNTIEDNVPRDKAAPDQTIKPEPWVYVKRSEI